MLLVQQATNFSVLLIRLVLRFSLVTLKRSLARAALTPLNSRRQVVILIRRFSLVYSLQALSSLQIVSVSLGRGQIKDWRFTYSRGSELVKLILLPLVNSSLSCAKLNIVSLIAFIVADQDNRQLFSFTIVIIQAELSTSSFRVVK